MKKNIQSNHQNKCFHLIYYSLEHRQSEIYKITPEQAAKMNKKGNIKISPKIEIIEDSYYLGKLCVQNDKLTFYKQIGRDREDLEKYAYTFIQAEYLREIEFFVNDIAINPNKYTEFYNYQKNGKLSEYITKKYNQLPAQIINSEIGEKYYKNGWSKSRNKELEKAIINFGN